MMRRQRDSTGEGGSLSWCMIRKALPWRVHDLMAMVSTWMPRMQSVREEVWMLREGLVFPQARWGV